MNGPDRDGKVIRNSFAASEDDLAKQSHHLHIDRPRAALVPRPVSLDFHGEHTTVFFRDDVWAVPSRPTRHIVAVVG